MTQCFVLCFKELKKSFGYSQDWVGPNFMVGRVTSIQPFCFTFLLSPNYPANNTSHSEFSFCTICPTWLIIIAKICLPLRSLVIFTYYTAQIIYKKPIQKSYFWVIFTLSVFSQVDINPITILHWVRLFFFNDKVDFLCWALVKVDDILTHS